MKHYILHALGTVLLLLGVVRTGGAVDLMQEYQRLRDVDYADAALVDSLLGDPADSLDAYLWYAALHNPGLEAAFDRWKAALEKVPQANALPDPRLTYSYYLSRVETRVGPQRQKLDISQTFPWFGTRGLRGEQSLEDAAARWEEFQEQRLELFHDVRRAYYDFYSLSRTIDVLREHMALLTSTEGVARARYTTGMLPFSDLLGIQVELGKLEERLGSLEDLREVSAEVFNTVLNRPTATSVPWPATLRDAPLLLTDDAVIALALKHNPGLAALEHLKKREAAARELAGKKRYPDITLGLSWIDTGNAAMPGVTDSGKDPVMPIVSINLPVWRGNYDAAEQESRLRERAAEADFTARSNMVVAELTKALYRYRDAGRKIDLYRDTLIPQARQAFMAARAAFEGGTGDFLGLIDAQRTLLEFELAHENAVATQSSAMADIDLLTNGTME